MPHSLARLIVVAILACIACNVAAGAFAQASAYLLTRAQPYRVIPAGTLLEIDRTLSIDTAKPGFAEVSHWPDEAFHIATESKTKLVGRFPRAVIIRVSTEGVRIIERDEEIAKMPLLHFDPTIERTMMVPTLQVQPLFNPDIKAPRFNSIEFPKVPPTPRPEQKKE